MAMTHRHTCPSVCEHSNRVLDVVFHYFACLRDSEKAVYFANLPQASQSRITKEQDRARKIAASFEKNPNAPGGILQIKFRQSLRAWRGNPGKPQHEDGQLFSYTADDDVESDIQARLIFFKNSRPYDSPAFPNEFPDQKMPLKRLLANDPETNPLMQSCDEDLIRYFHLPANNMKWVEEAIARYYHEGRPDHDNFHHQARRSRHTKSEMILNPEFWRGQQLGDAGSEVHARSMRPLCETISTNAVSAEATPRNIVLFMPYLHWETDRGRRIAAEVTKEAGKAMFASLGEVVDTVTAERPTEDQTLTRIPTEKTVVARTLVQRRALLGSLLLLAAKLSEATDSFIDEKLMLQYLHKDAQLHPRRTLDQSYYGALKNTQARDRDQVVYRATTPSSHECARKFFKDANCRRCQEDIRKRPRLIMVDQLWLWVLDEKTVITSFPKRWGRNIADSSGVHASIRTRLISARQDEIRSAFDLAIIIVDQCSRVFFDRTRSIGQQPNLGDIFADSIRTVTYKQTAAFDAFLQYTHLASKDHHSRDTPFGGSSAMENTLLNINPEGNLLKEIKDILDELHILTRVKIQQQVVAETFVKHIRQILLPKVAAANDFNLALPSEASLLAPGTPGAPGQKDSIEMRREQLAGAKWTLARAEVLLTGIERRIAELNTLSDAAQHTSTALKDLLTLKQQQAGVIEAREAVKQASETLKQGRSIMLFTVIAIIFLPLSFCTSLFGMNSKEFSDGSKLTLRQQFSYMFPISVAIVITSFTLAFSSNTFLSGIFTVAWATVAYPINVAFTWLLTRSGIYTFSRGLKGKAKVLADRKDTITAHMKSDALRERMEWKVAKELSREQSVDHELKKKMKKKKHHRDEEEGVGTKMLSPSASHELLSYPKTVTSDVSSLP